MNNAARKISATDNRAIRRVVLVSDRSFRIWHPALKVGDMNVIKMRNRGCLFPDSGLFLDASKYVVSQGRLVLETVLQAPNANERSRQNFE